MAPYLSSLLSGNPPPRRIGVLVAIAAVALCTAIVYPLKQVAPVVSLGVVYLPAVLIVSAIWSGWLGAATAVLSAAALNYFHLVPAGAFSLRDPGEWVALAAFLVVAWMVSAVAQMSRARAREAAERRREADLAAEMARLLLRGNPLHVDLPVAAARLAEALGLPSASIELGVSEGDERHLAFPLREGPRRLGTLLVGAGADEQALRRLQERVVPALEALLSAALEREALLGDVVETAALRRADVVKTALLRAVSHDLRSPLTAIATAADAISSPSVSDHERLEMADVVRQETRRLSRLVDNLLDLSRLEAGVASPHLVPTSVEELIHAALQEISAKPGEFTLTIDREIPLVRADPLQLERAFANVLENARRHRGEHPVSVRARAVQMLSSRAGADAGAARPVEPGAAEPEHRQLPGVEPAGTEPLGDRVVVRVVDRGPGIPRAQLERIFEPFYTAGTPEGGRRRSGLGLAIARGFAEANGARLYAESLPGQGASFVLEIPLEPQASSAEPARADLNAASTGR